jgi:hypothetical protein
VNVYLDLLAGMKDRIWSHLLQNEVEQVAFAFASVTEERDSIVFSAQELYLASPSDFTIHSEFHVELTDAARAGILKRAWDSKTTPVEFHSHPGDVWGAMFSPSDLSGFEEYVPHCRWRLRGRPYAAVVVSPAGFDALTWVMTDKSPVGLTALREEDSAATPTMQTVRALARKHPEEHRHGS